MWIVARCPLGHCPGRVSEPGCAPTPGDRRWPRGARARRSGLPAAFTETWPPCCRPARSACGSGTVPNGGAGRGAAPGPAQPDSVLALRRLVSGFAGAPGGITVDDVERPGAGAPVNPSSARRSAPSSARPPAAAAPLVVMAWRPGSTPRPPSTTGATTSGEVWGPAASVAGRVALLRTWRRHRHTGSMMCRCHEENV